MPQPYRVPVRPSVSRNTHSSGVSGSTSTCCARPLMVRWGIFALLDLFPGGRARPILAPIIGPFGGIPNFPFGRHASRAVSGSRSDRDFEPAKEDDSDHRTGDGPIN